MQSAEWRMQQCMCKTSRAVKQASERSSKQAAKRTLGQKPELQSPSADHRLLLNTLPWHAAFFVILQLAAAVPPPVQQAPEQNIFVLQAVLDEDHVPPAPSQSLWATLLLQP
jgi:hypothetical protein